MAPGRGVGQALRQRRNGPILPVRHVPRDARLNRLNTRRPGSKAIRDFRKNPFCLTISVTFIVLFLAFLAFLSPTMPRSIDADEIPWSQSSRYRREGRVRRKRGALAGKEHNSRQGARGTEQYLKEKDDENAAQQGRHALNKIKQAYNERTSREKISCPDGSIGFFNDNYCDCDDGSDEPGTSACSNLLVSKQIFSCADGNGKIFTSRVGDGISDCMDGSDEHHTERG
uniref:Glucosidase II beta subunit N-terminal domain-containing protein n=1 Tax=Odontella aurita TaxID=265563 RepID=A0A6U6FEW6_9STRA|mmetsp:Transcript_34110/g.102004  ORF Transcript_34110/g.102004 Transcript_34110/m.102004 type:complete len:228 (+) Transcript_34110:181-864(+)